MRWIRFSTAGRTCYGVIEGDRIAESGESPFEGWRRTGRTHLLEAVKIAIPVVPRTFYAAGLNYVAHVTHAAHLLGNEPDLPEKPDIGYRANNALIAHDEEVVIPRDATEKVQYEGELVVVIGKKAKNLSEAEALSCVLGYTIGNDVSERTWQRGDRTLWPGDVMWMGTDGASPNLKHNDVVEVEITGIGTLRNRFVRES